MFGLHLHVGCSHLHHQCGERRAACRQWEADYAVQNDEAILRYGRC